MENKHLKGGAFLISESDFNANFIPEEFNEEHKINISSSKFHI